MKKVIGQYELEEQERIKNPDGTGSPILKPAIGRKKQRVKTLKSLTKETTIEEQIADRDTQLNLLGATLREVIIHLGLDVHPTPTVANALAVLEAIEAVLEKK